MHHHARQSDDKSVEPLTFKTGKTALKGESDHFPVTVSPVRFHRYVFVVELRGKQKEKHVLHKFSKVRLNTGKLGCISPKSRKQWRQDQDGGFIICNFNFEYNPTIGHVKLGVRKPKGKYLTEVVRHVGKANAWLYNRVVTRYMRSGITAPGSGITTLGIGISSVLVESGIKIVNVFGIRDQNSQCFCDQGLKFSTFLWSGIKIWGKNTGSVIKKYTLLRPWYNLVGVTS